jgi:hypothetical protein
MQTMRTRNMGMGVIVGAGMKAFAIAAAVILTTLGSLPGPVAATEVLRPKVLEPNPFAMTPPPAPLEPRPAPAAPSRPPHVHPGRPPVFGYPAAGYWAYQWVPTAYTTYVWVPGYGYYPHVVTSGYYQRVWVGY